MKIVQRNFTTIAALRGMMLGFKMLYGVQPIVNIITTDNHGNPTGVRCEDGELLFTGLNGVTLIDIGNRYITVNADDANARIDVASAEVQFDAAFYVD